MRQCRLLAVILLLSFHGLSVAGETPLQKSLATVDPQTGVAWFDARDIGVEGKAWDDTEAFYDRLPARAKAVVRSPVWNLSRQTAGMCVRFASNAPSLHVRWQLTSDRLAMAHMPATGVSGVDLYVHTDDGWRWLAVGQPTATANDVRLIKDIASQRRTYLLYLPLYNGVASLEIGIPQGSKLWPQQVEPTDGKPIVFWGTSITQGGCASRPGMVHTAILGRRLSRPIINLGFSGNGKMEPEVAQLIAEIDAAAFVIDCLPNLKSEAVAKRTQPLVSILRKQHSRTPILLVEDRSYTNAFLIERQRLRNQQSRVALRSAFTELQQAGVPALYYLSGNELLGSDGEDTVDGSHPTDLGFLRQANAFEPVIRKMLEQKIQHVNQ